MPDASGGPERVIQADNVFEMSSWVVNKPKKVLQRRASEGKNFHRGGHNIDQEMHHQDGAGFAPTSNAAAGWSDHGIAEPTKQATSTAIPGINEEDLLRTFCGKAQAEANMGIQKSESIDRLSCPKGVSLAGRIAQSVLHSRSYKNLFFTNPFPEDDVKKPTKTEQAARDKALSQPVKPLEARLEKFTSQVAFGRSVPILEPLLEEKLPWNQKKGSKTRSGGGHAMSNSALGTHDSELPTYYTQNGRSLGTTGQGDHGLDPQNMAQMPRGPLAPVPEADSAIDGGNRQQNFLYYQNPKEEAKKPRDSWVDRLSKPRAVTEKFEFPVFVVDTAPADVAASHEDHDQGESEDARKSSKASNSKAACSSSLPASRRASLRKNSLGNKVPDELRNAVHKLVEQNRKPEIVVPADDPYHVGEHFVDGTGPASGSAPSGVASLSSVGVAPRISSDGLVFGGVKNAGSKDKLWPGEDTTGGLSKSRPFIRGLVPRLPLGAPGDHHAQVDGTPTRMSGGDQELRLEDWQHRLKSVSQLEQKSKSRRIPLQTLDRRIDPSASEHQSYHSSSSTYGSQNSSSSSGAGATAGLDSETQARVEELFYLLILVCRKTGGNQSLRQRVQQLLLADIQPVFKRIGRRVPFHLVNSAPTGTGGSQNTSQYCGSPDSMVPVLQAFKKHCPLLSEQLSKQAERCLGRERVDSRVVLAVRDVLLKKEFVQTAVNGAGDGNAAGMAGAGGGSSNAVTPTASRSVSKASSSSSSSSSLAALAGITTSTKTGRGASANSGKIRAPGAAQVGNITIDDGAEADPFAEISALFVSEWEAVQEQNRIDERRKREEDKSRTYKAPPPPKKTSAEQEEELDALGLC
ncbi:unnamed protein product [Amoebophrya sp. A25]|nr:unnamed protein product [Amoebophrya sp. A25]|eukprot:GSA25T00002229001.1